MAFRFTDQKIPKRPAQGGREGRSVFDAADAPEEEAANSRWKIITQEELFCGSEWNPAQEDPGQTAALFPHHSYGLTGQGPDPARMPRRTTGVSEQDEAYHDSERMQIRSPEYAETDQFTGLIRLMRSYQVTDRGRRNAFLEQAEWMETYEEEARIPETEFYHQYVGYQEMDVCELHSYFSWRTRFRRGERVPYCFEFMRLHAAELINLFGVSGMQEAFDRLLLLQAVPYRRKDLLRGGPDRSGPGGRDSLRKASGPEGRMYGAPPADRTKMREILADFVVAWAAEAQEEPLPGSGVFFSDLLEEYGILNPEEEAENTTLLHFSGSDDAALFRTIQSLASNRLRNSEFLKQAGEDGWRVIARVFRRVCAEPDKAACPASDRHPQDSDPRAGGRQEQMDNPAAGRQGPAGCLSLAERMLGRRRTLQRNLFSMMPYETRAQEGCHVEVSPALSYSFHDGRWYRSDYSLLRDEAALRELDGLVRECERILRRKMHYRNQLPDRMHNPKLSKLIEEETDRWLKEKARRNRPEVCVDLARLGSIRDQAAITRERLLEGTGEGAESDALLAMMNNPAAVKHDSATVGTIQAGVGDSVTAQAGAEDSATAQAEAGKSRAAQAGAEDTGRAQEEAGSSGDTGHAQASGGIPEENGIFTSPEAAFLRLLLDGGNSDAFFREHKVFPSVFVDTVNEKAFDEIGDSIVEETGGGWQLVEDYEEEVRKLLRSGRDFS